MGFYHVGQTDLELLTSSDLPTSAFQNAWIIGVSHHAWPVVNTKLSNIGQWSTLNYVNVVHKLDDDDNDNGSS